VGLALSSHLESFQALDPWRDIEHLEANVRLPKQLTLFCAKMTRLR
jgi:hypothetical protein